MPDYSLWFRHFFFILLVTFAFYGCAPELTEAEHVSRAKEFQEKGDFRAAIIELKSALKKNPRNQETRTLLGELYVKVGNGPSAEKELRRAINLGVSKEALMSPLAKALAMQNKYQEILNEINIPQSLSSVQQAELYAYRGDAWLGLGKREKAEAAYKQALNLDPQSPLAKLGIARIAMGDKKISEAARLVEEALSFNPELGRAWRFKAKILEAQRKLKGAEEAYTKAIQFNPINIPDLASRALLRIEMGRLEEAAKDIQVVKKKAPKYFLGYFSAGLLALKQQRFDDALSELEQARKLNERYPQTHYFQGLTFLLKGQQLQTEAAIRRYLSLVPGSVKGHQVLAWVQYKMKHYDAAKNTLAPVVEALPKDLFSRMLMSRIEFALGNHQKAIEHMQALLELNPDSPGLYAQLGMGLGSIGKLEEGEKALKKSLEINPDFLPARVQLTMLYLRNKRFDEARKEISIIQEKLPDSVLGLGLLGLLQVKQGHIEEAENTFEQALALEPGNPAIAHNLAQLAADRNDFKKARELYKQVLKHHPDNLNAAMHLVMLDAMEGKAKSAITHLEEIVQKHPDVLAPRLSLARTYIQMNEFGRAQSLLEKIRPLYPDSVPLLMVLLEAQIEEGQIGRAQDTAKKLRDLAPNSPLSHFFLAQVFMKSGDFARAQMHLEKAVLLDKKFLPAHLALVKLEIKKGDLKNAQAILTKIKKSYPENPKVLSLQAELAMRQNEPQKAIKLYQRALAKKPDSETAVALSRAYWRVGKQEKAEETLDDWLKKYPQDLKVAYMRSVLYRTMGEDKRAIKQLEEILQKNPKQADVLNDLAWMLRNQDPDKALQYVEKAVEIDPNAGMISDTLAMVLLARGERGRALTVMQPVAEKFNFPSVQYHWAKILVANRRRQEAIKVLEKLLNNRASFPEREEAQNLLADLRN